MVVWFEIMTSSKLKKVLDQTEHRPYPLPKGPRVLRVRRPELPFMHYPVSDDWLRPLTPPVLELDTFDESMWLGVMPYRMRRAQHRFLPAISWLSSLPELNVCTYVTAEGQPTIWFYSLEASTPIAARLARATYALAYFGAKMSCRTFRNKVQYKSHAYPQRRLVRQARSLLRPTQRALVSARYSGERPHPALLSV
jgi:uncharacterized protein YqjF (DUF2071 family)